MLRSLANSAPWMGLALVLGSVCSCSSSSSDPSTAAKANERVGDIHTNDVWKDGYKLTGLIRIFEGATVEIEPGASIACSDAVQIQVGGKLLIRGGSKRTSINCNHWRGLLVAADGQLDVTGLDTANADVGIESTKGAGTITITDSTITTTPKPFLIREGSTITATKVTATTPTTLAADVVSVSEVWGTFIAKYLTYEANTNEGVMVENGGSADISDSTMVAKNGFDLISSYGGKSLKVSYTTMSGGHCGIHLGAAHDNINVLTGSLTVDHVTSQENLFGITIYGASATGPHSVKSSNFGGAADWLDIQGEHGPIDFEDNYVAGKVNVLNTEIPTFNAPAAAPVADAKPH